MYRILLLAVLCWSFGLALLSRAADQPQWGEKFSRNMISEETGLPHDFKSGRRAARTGLIDLASTQNVRWIAPLGPAVHGTPVIAQNRVLVGSNGSQSPLPALQGDRGVLTCLDEKTGELIWELIVPKMHEIKFADWYNVGLASVPVIEDSKVYVLSNRAEVLCLDLDGLKNGNDGPFQEEAKHRVEPGVEPPPLTEKDADIIWCTDLVEELGVMPHNAANCAILVDGDLLYVSTGNGVDWTHRRVMNPSAPSLVVLDKKNGRILARDDFNLGPNIIHGQWSSPTLGVVDGRRLVFQGTGSGYLFAVEALKRRDIQKARNSGELIRLKTVWKFNGHPLAQEQEIVPLEHFHDTRSYEVTGNPVFYNDRLYVVFTQEMFHNIPDGWIVCLDPSKTGDITRNGGLIWSYDGISSSSSTPAIADGLLYIADGSGRLHCLDAATGGVYWVQPLEGAIWGSPLLADGKIYVGTAGKRFYILEQGKEPKILARIIMPDQVLCSATTANGVLYVPVFGMLYAVEVAPTGK
ncbi:MAG: PQQ-binding-like beta-propeller repeat protein [Thermoguttaceae bacterium]